MNILTGESSDLFFGGEVPAAVHPLLHQAARAQGDQRAALLWTAQALAPSCLATYYAIYKHHAGRRELAQAEQAALRGLQQAALQAGLPADWRAVTPPLSPATRSSEAGRFWLFTLKALAFISLRSGQPERARELLNHLNACDPEARIGADVITALITGSAARGPQP